ncbi:MAG TPA: sulfite exporter TauE/SafE family protein [Acidimicrobiales bacterium]|nr:sulfite exporter TauE/SafE family protein [Acidimicrobiales bacterium]
MPVTLLDDVAVGAAGVVAGAVNAIAGAGSLLTFPVLVGVGLSPLSANVTNSIGVVPGNLAGTWGFRRELTGQRRRLAGFAVPATLGSVLGGVLILILPSHSFALVAPVLVGAASLLTLAQPLITSRIDQARTRRNSRALAVAIFAVSVYGGYFGSGIGVLFIALLSIFVIDELSRLNAAKTVLQALANGIAGILFAFFGPVHWWLVLILAASTSLGAPIGARLSVHIPARVLRPVIGVVGLGAAVYLGLRA